MYKFHTNHRQILKHVQLLIGKENQILILIIFILFHTKNLKLQEPYISNLPSLQVGGQHSGGIVLSTPSLILTLCNFGNLALLRGVVVH